MHSELTPFEDELRQTLRRVEPPAGFAEGVLGRVAVENQSHPSRGPAAVAGRLPALRLGLAAALILMLLLPLAGYLHRQHQEAQARAAAQQFALAMRLTHAALVDAGQQIAEHKHRDNE